MVLLPLNLLLPHRFLVAAVLVITLAAFLFLPLHLLLPLNLLLSYRFLVAAVLVITLAIVLLNSLTLFIVSLT